MTRRSKVSAVLAAALAATVVSGLAALPATAEPATPAAKTPTKAEIGAMLETCSKEADAKGLTVQKGKGAERKTYRRQCMAKNGVLPKKS